MGDLRYHAKSPVSLDAMGRGMMKKPHPHEIRIPQCISCSLSASKILTERTKDGRPLRGRGRGGQPSFSPSLQTYSARERLIRQSLDSQKMDEKEGKGFLLERFLGQQAHNLNFQTQGTLSHSSGHSRRTCPPSFKTSTEEWPGLQRSKSGSTSQIFNQKNVDKSKTKDAIKPLVNHKLGNLNSALPGSNIRRYHSEEVLKVGSRTSQADEERNGKPEKRRTSEVNPDGSEGEDRNANNNCTKHKVHTMEPINADNDKKADVGNTLESSQVKTSHDPAMNKPEIKQDQSKLSLSTLAKEINSTNGKSDEEQNKHSLSTLAKEVSSMNGKSGDEFLDEKFDEDSEDPSQTGKSNVEEISAMEVENEVNYRLLRNQEQFMPGDLLPLSGQNVLQIEGLPEGIKDEDVSDLFLSCGRVTACKVLRDADTKLCIGIAYIRLEESSACAMAVSSFNDESSPFTEFYEDGNVPTLNVHHVTVSP